MLSNKGRDHRAGELTGQFTSASFPYDHFKSGKPQEKRDTFFYRFSDRLFSSIQLLNRFPYHSLHEILVAGLAALLHKYTGNTDIVIGTPLYQKFITTSSADMLFPIRVLIEEAAPFEQIVQQVRKEMVKVIGCREAAEDIFRDYPDISVGLTLENIQDITCVGNSGPDIVFSFTRYNDCLVAKAIYNPSLYEALTIRRLMQHYNELLNQGIEHGYVSLLEMGILSLEEKNRIRYVFNGTKREYDNTSLTVMQLFEDRVRRHPDRIAVVYGKDKMTYAAFNREIDRLAFALRARGVGRGQLVAIMMERSVDMLIGIYGIIKAGAAYLPVDPDYPQERILYMLKDSDTRWLLIHEQTDFFPAMTGVTVLRQNYPAEEGDGLVISNEPSDLAYVIYTSGSTGYPKGVMIEQRSLLNRLNWMQRQYPIDERDILIQKTSFSFDVSVWELFWWALAGSTVCLPEPKAEKYSDRLIEIIAEQSVTVMHFVPSMLSIFLDYLEEMEEAGRLNTLRQVFVSGEAIPSAVVKKFYKLLPWCNLSNLYGPTEATIDVTYYDCPKENIPGNIPIGKPIDNIEIYIVDRYLQPLPIGVTGELCISGIGVAKGYINKEELTGLQFVKMSWHEGILYRTGDLAKWLPDGNIEYAGRADSQVKIRGYRVELNEIEYQLHRHPDLRHAIVTTYKDEETAETMLVAYIVEKNKISASQLRGFLAQHLPEYMIPAFFVPIKELPLTANHKIDKKALPSPYSLFSE